MRRAVLARRKVINQRCRYHGFSFPTLFGSTARGDRTRNSDVDILVWTLGDDQGAAERSKVLAGEISILLGAEVEISIGEWIHPAVADRALRTGTVLFRWSGPSLRLRRWRNRRSTERWIEEVPAN